MNTFAIISFSKNYISYPKYEYLSDEDIENTSNHNQIDSNNETIIDEDFYRFWVIRNKDNELEKVSAAFISDDNLNDVFFGPCDSLEELNKKLNENNIITVN